MPGIRSIRLLFVTFAAAFVPPHVRPGLISSTQTSSHGNLGLGLNDWRQGGRKARLVRQNPLGVADTPKMSIDAPPSSPVSSSVAPDVSAEDEERLRTVCVALLGRCGKIEDILDMGDKDGSGSLNLAEFNKLLVDLEVACSEEDARYIFEMIDDDGSGTIDAGELGDKIRGSGAITQMYSESLQTFGYLLAATLAFAAGLAVFKSPTAGFDFLTCYAVEDSLSVDNLFVFLLIFRYFKVPPDLQKICLNYGIAGAIVLRAIFIFAGLAAVNAFQPLLLGFSGFLLFSSYQLLVVGEDDDDEEEDEPPEIVTNILEKLPTSGTFEGDTLLVQGDKGGWQATQLLVTLLTIELSDLLFAVDSIPAVFAVTNDPLVVYTSNIAAISGLRALYQLLAIAVEDLVYLEKAVALVLGFVGLKLGLEVAGVDVSSALSLSVIVGLLGGGIVLSKVAPPDDDDFDGDSRKQRKQNVIEAWVKKIAGSFEIKN